MYLSHYAVCMLLSVLHCAAQLGSSSGVLSRRCCTSVHCLKPGWCTHKGDSSRHVPPDKLTIALVWSQRSRLTRCGEGRAGQACHIAHRRIAYCRRPVASVPIGCGVAHHHHGSVLMGPLVLEGSCKKNPRILPLYLVWRVLFSCGCIHRKFYSVKSPQNTHSMWRDACWHCMRWQLMRPPVNNFERPCMHALAWAGAGISACRQTASGSPGVRVLSAAG
jgi:hypothetical protein